MTQEFTQQNMSLEKNSSLSLSIIDRIEKEHVMPEPKWKFMVGEYSIWVLWAFSVVCGAIAVSAMLFVSLHAGYAFYEATHETALSFFIEVLPYVWICIFIAMAGLAYMNVRNTKTGYRYPLWQILSSSLLLSIIGGGVLHYAGVGYLIDTQVHRSFPIFPSIEKIEERMWQNPKEGRMMGVVREYQAASNTALFEDIEGEVWVINTEELMQPDLQILNTGNKVRVVGVMSSSSEDNFHGCGVFPWMYDKPLPIHTMQSERNAFLERMYEQKKNFEKQIELFEDSLEVPPLKEKMESVCARQAFVRRIELKMAR